MRNVGVREIARKTGFSPATVSNALSHKRSVSKETAEIIQKAAHELGYDQVNELSQVNFVLARRTGKVLDEGTFHPGVMEGVERAAGAEGLKTVFTNLELSSRSVAEKQVSLIIHDPSNAVVLLGTEMEEKDYQLFADAEVPIVVVDGWSDRLFFECIVTSNENSSFHAVNHLIEMGHREIGYITGDYQIRNFPLRERGYRRAMHEAGLTINPAFRVTVGTTVSTAHDAMDAWLSGNPKLPTAFFAENDIMAFGCMRALTEHGVKIPDDVSIIGFDDLSFATVANPPLSTEHVYNREMGELAVKTLMDRVRDPRPFTSVVHFSTTFVERESVRML